MQIESTEVIRVEQGQLPDGGLFKMNEEFYVKIEMVEPTGFGVSEMRKKKACTALHLQTGQVMSIHYAVPVIYYPDAKMIPGEPGEVQEEQA